MAVNSRSFSIVPSLPGISLLTNGAKSVACRRWWGERRQGVVSTLGRFTRGSDLGQGREQTEPQRPAEPGDGNQGVICQCSLLSPTRGSSCFRQPKSQGLLCLERAAFSKPLLGRIKAPILWRQNEPLYPECQLPHAFRGHEKNKDPF